MPNRYIGPGLLLLKIPEVAPFIPLSNDPKRQLVYNSAKVFAKLTGQNKHLAEAIYDLCWGDFKTVCENFANCKNDEEVRTAWLELVPTVGVATAADVETGRDLGELAAAGVAATQKLAEYEAKSALLKAATDTAVKNELLPPEMQQIINEIVNRGERPSEFSVILRLRGPKPNETSFSVPNRPPSENAVDRFKNFFRSGNSTAVNNIGRGGAIQLDTTELQDSNKFKKLISLITRNQKRILFCAVIGGIFYIVFKKRSALKRFFKSLKKLFKDIHLIYERVTKNHILNNGLTRRILIFSRAVNRI